MLKKIVLSFPLTIVCFLATIILSSPVSALETGDIVIQLQPAEQDISLAPGEVFEGSLKIQNIGRLAFDFNLSTRPFQILNDDYDPDFSTENNYTLLKNWISFPTSQFHLEPGEEVKAVFKVDTPLDVPAGGQYASIIAETRDAGDKSLSIRTVGQVASILYAKIAGNSRLEGTLVDHYLPNILFGKPLSASITARNSGNEDFRVTHQLTISDFFTGREVFGSTSVDSEGKPLGIASPRVMPGSSRTNILTWNGAPQLGLFRVVQSVSMLDKTETFEQIVLLCPIWLLGGVVFIVVLMVVWLILRARSHRRSRPQTF